MKTELDESSYGQTELGRGFAVFSKLQQLAPALVMNGFQDEYLLDRHTSQDSCCQAKNCTWLNN